MPESQPSLGGDDGNPQPSEKMPAAQQAAGEPKPEPEAGKASSPKQKIKQASMRLNINPNSGQPIQMAQKPLPVPINANGLDRISEEAKHAEQNEENKEEKSLEVLSAKSSKSSKKSLQSQPKNQQEEIRPPHDNLQFDKSEGKQSDRMANHHEENKSMKSNKSSQRANQRAAQFQNNFQTLMDLENEEVKVHVSEEAPNEVIQPSQPLAELHPPKLEELSP